MLNRIQFGGHSKYRLAVAYFRNAVDVDVAAGQLPYCVHSGFSRYKSGVPMSV